MTTFGIMTLDTSHHAEFYILILLLSYAKDHFVECHFAKCRYGECRGAIMKPWQKSLCGQTR